jgi:CBS domain-containing membrane protein
MAGRVREDRVAAVPAASAAPSGRAPGPVGRALAAVRREADVGGPALAVYAGAVAAVAMALAGLVGIVVHQPWLFPSLGPTIMIIAETPGQAAAHPRNVFVGHVVAVAAGWLALLVTGLRTGPSAIEAGLDARRVAAAVISLVLTVVTLQLLRLPHAPAGATTLIVGLGILKMPGDLVVLILSVLLVTIVASGANILAAVRQVGVTDAPRPHRLVRARQRAGLGRGRARMESGQPAMGDRTTGDEVAELTGDRPRAERRARRTRARPHAGDQL